MPRRRFRRDIEIHIRDIAEKYLISGETQDTAFMFVPSESVFAEIHENFEALVQKAHRARVVIVSPSLLMLSIQVVQAILKDARMREQAHLIQGEVARLMEDLGRLDDRVRKLQTHFLQASKDIDDILVSSGKVSRRGAKIEALEFGGDPATMQARLRRTAAVRRPTRRCAPPIRRPGSSGCASSRTTTDVAASEREQLPHHRMVGIGKPVDDVEMVAVGLFDHRRHGAEPGPDVGEQCVLAHELAALAGAHPAGQPARPRCGRSSAGLSANASASSSLRSAFSASRIIGLRS